MFTNKIPETSETSEISETLSDIALKLIEEEKQPLPLDYEKSESTLFILGSKGVGKTTIVNKFLKRNEQHPQSTLALEYAFCRRAEIIQQLSKDIFHIWELGSLENSKEIIKVPFKMHGLDKMNVIIMIDLSQPLQLQYDLEIVLEALRQISNDFKENILKNNENLKKIQTQRDLIYEKHEDFQSIQLIPFPVVIVGGKYDLFMKFEPELKKHICIYLRSVAHLIGSAIVFYSNQIPKLTKTVNDIVQHLGFGSPSVTIRTKITDYNDSLAIWFGMDKWSDIDLKGVQTLDIIKNKFFTSLECIYSTKYFNNNKLKTSDNILNPAKDVNFQETSIDDILEQKMEQLKYIMREMQCQQFNSKIT